jgi:hypothetical protein
VIDAALKEKMHVPTVIRRLILPAFFLSAGLASLMYGARFHRVPVLAEVKTQTSIDVPEPMQIPPPFPGDQGFNEPPRTRKQIVERTTEITINEFEPALIREVSVGGVALNTIGEIKRTYSGKPPSLCPT